MKKSSRELKQTRGDVEKKANDLLKKVNDENRDFTAEERTEVTGYETQLDELDSQIRAAESAEKLAARAAGGPTSTKADDDAVKQFSFREACLAAASKRGPEGFLLEMHQEAVKEAQRSGIAVNPGSILIPELIVSRSDFRRSEKRAGVNATTGTAGGYDVATELVGYEQALRAESVLMGLGAKFVPGAVGNIDVPLENAVYTAGWTTETGSVAQSSPTLTKKTFSPKRLGGYIDLSMQWLLQTAPAFEGFIKDQIVLGQAEAIDIAGIKGGGSNEPTGILADSGITICFAGGAAVIGTNADGAAPIWADAINLKQALAKSNALKGSLGYLTTPNVAGVWQMAKRDAGSGLFVWNDENDKVGGFRGVQSTHVPSAYTKGSGTGLSAIIFGDFSKLMIVQWGGMEILTDPYTQAVAGNVRLVANTFTDLAVLRGAAFAAIKDAIAI